MLSSLHRILAQLAPRLTPYPSCLLSLILPLLVLDAAHAASFDCEKANSKVEKLICKNEEISVLDEKMASAYQEAQQRALSPQALRKEQKAWLNLRNFCRPEDVWEDPPLGYDEAQCLQEVYENRIKELHARYLVPPELSPNALDFMRSNNSIEVTRATSPICNAFLHAAQEGIGITRIRPTCENCSFGSNDWHQNLDGCDPEINMSSESQVPRSVDGIHYLMKTGTFFTTYDRFDMWTFAAGNNEEIVSIYSDGSFYDAKKTGHAERIGPFWSNGPYFTLINKSKCKRIGVFGVHYVPWSGSAPPATRQSEIIGYLNDKYLLTMGVLGVSPEDPHHILLARVGSNDVQLICGYVEHK